MAFAKRYCRKLDEVDLAKIIDFIQQPKHQQHGIRLIRDIVLKFANELDNPILRIPYKDT
jgi:hypothetical protein